MPGRVCAELLEGQVHPRGLQQVQQIGSRALRRWQLQRTSWQLRDVAPWTLKAQHLGKSSRRMLQVVPVLRF